MPQMYILPAHLHAVSAGGREFHANESNQVDLEGLAPEMVTQLVELVGIVAARTQEDTDAEAALAAEKARHAAEVARQTLEAHEAALGLDKKREEAAQRKVQDEAARLELETLRRAQREAEVAAAPIEPSGFEQPAEEAAPVPAAGVFPPSRKKK